MLIENNYCVEFINLVFSHVCWVGLVVHLSGSKRNNNYWMDCLYSEILLTLMVQEDESY